MPAEIDITNADQVGEEIAAALTPGVVAVVADMTDTNFCDSPAVTMLVRAHLRATGHNAELRLVICARHYHDQEHVNESSHGVLSADVVQAPVRRAGRSEPGV